MRNIDSTKPADSQVTSVWLGRTFTFLQFIVLAALIGCGTAKTAKKRDDFFTSGSRAADQRATQRMAKEEQLSGAGEGTAEKGAKKAEPTAQGGTGEGKPAQVEGKLALFDRLGAEKGLTAIIEDFIPRVLQDPRVNWERKGVTRHRLFRPDQSVAWDPSAENVANLKKHFVQFMALATGGPAQYDGKEIKPVHAGMHISNPEFEAAIGDLKASLDKLQVPNKEQKELLAIIESTRPQIVTER